MPAAAVAAVPTVNEAIVDVSEASYPILKALRPDTFGPFSEKLSNLILDIRPEKLGKTLDLAVDVFNSVPLERLKTFGGEVKTAFEGLSPTSPTPCTLVPLPSATIAPKFAAIAASRVEPSKLKEFDEKWGSVLTALPKTEAAICLPPVDKLTQLALAQAEIGRAFGSEESQRFAGYAGPLLKSSFTLGKVLPLVNDAKRLTPTATPREITAFQNAGKRVEVASTAEAQRARLAQLKERSAEIEAAKAAGKPIPLATSASSSANAVLQEELAASREAAAKEATARKQAAFEANEQRRAALKQAEAARVAELKAKAEAIAAAKAEGRAVAAAIP